MLQNHLVAALLSAVPEPNLVNRQRVAVQGPTEPVKIVVCGELEEAGEGVVGLDGQMVVVVGTVGVHIFW